MPVNQARAWFGLLSDLNVEQMARGFELALQQQQFPGHPPIGIIRKLALGEMDANSIELDGRALLAWGVVLQEIRSTGAYRTVRFDDPAIQAAVRTVAGANGWAGLCDVPSHEMKWAKRDFIAAYKVHAAAGVSASLAAPLCGLIDQANSAHGYGGLDVTTAIACNLPGPKPAVKADATTKAIPSPIVANLVAKMKPADAKCDQKPAALPSKESPKADDKQRRADQKAALLARENAARDALANETHKRKAKDDAAFSDGI